MVHNDISFGVQIAKSKDVFNIMLSKNTWVKCNLCLLFRGCAFDMQLQHWIADFVGAEYPLGTLGEPQRVVGVC